MKWNVLLSILLLYSGISANIISKMEIDLESGLVQTGYNDVAIPGNSGDRFSLNQDLKAENPLFFRFRLNYHVSDKSEFSLLYAPLTIKSSGKFDQDINFDNVIFAANDAIDATYTFNSYRLTYIYRLLKNDRWQLKMGLTGKIRDAEIKLKSAAESASKTNVGFVPIIHFSGRYELSEKINLELSGDALAAPQGRAEDVLAAFFYQVSPKLELKLGYRLLEGGSDNDEVYTFALIHYAVIGLKYKF